MKDPLYFSAFEDRDFWDPNYRVLMLSIPRTGQCACKARAECSASFALMSHYLHTIGTAASSGKPDSFYIQIHWPHFGPDMFMSLNAASVWAEAFCPWWGFLPVLVVVVVLFVLVVPMLRVVLVLVLIHGCLGFYAGIRAWGLGT